MPKREGKPLHWQAFSVLDKRALSLGKLGSLLPLFSVRRLMGRDPLILFFGEPHKLDKKPNVLLITARSRKIAFP